MFQQRGDCLSPYMLFLSRHTSCSLLLVSYPSGLLHEYLLLEGSIKECCGHIQLMQLEAMLHGQRYKRAQRFLSYNWAKGLVIVGSELLTISLSDQSCLVSLY